MPNTKQVAKRLRQDQFRRMRNKSVKTRIHTMTKKVYEAEEPEETRQRMRTTFGIIDSAAKRHTIHWKKAARKKSRLARAVNKKLAAESGTPGGSTPDASA